MDKKLVFNITFHNQLEHLKFHLDIITQWGCNKNTEFVITSAHKENINEIKRYCDLNFPKHIFDFFFVEEDRGYHKGTLYNVNEGIKYINTFKQYDYLRLYKLSEKMSRMTLIESSLFKGFLSHFSSHISLL